jgi:hypothetical protein
MTSKPTKTREELAALIMDRLNGLPECRVVTGVVIAPVPSPEPGHANWHADFTAKARQPVPSAARRIGGDVAEEFDLDGT